MISCKGDAFDRIESKDLDVKWATSNRRNWEESQMSSSPPDDNCHRPEYAIHLRILVQPGQAVYECAVYELVSDICAQQPAQNQKPPVGPILRIPSLASFRS
jgi:hypothetical protein